MKGIIMRSRSRLALFTSVCVCLLLVTSCLAPGPDRRIGTLLDMGDPAAVYDNVSWGVTQVYVTNRGKVRVPTFKVDTGGSAMGGITDALPTLPTWVQAYPGNNILVWAPTVRQVAGRFLLMFSGSRSTGSNCIGVGTSSNDQGSAGPFTPVQGQWCDPDTSIGYIDPQIFVDPSDNNVYLYWSEQWAPNGGSRIEMQQLSSDGLTLLPYTRRTLFDYNDVKPYAGNTGVAGFLENPQMVKDGYNGYNLLVSIGTWQESNYKTFEMPCFAPNDYCNPSLGGVVPLTAAGSNGTGGASLVSDGSPANNFMFFAAHPYAGTEERGLYLAPTSEYNGNSPSLRPEGKVSPGGPAAGLTEQQAKESAVRSAVDEPVPPHKFYYRNDRPGLDES